MPQGESSHRDRPQAREAERKLFLKLADRLAGTHDPEEWSRLKGELVRLTFGE